MSLTLTPLSRVGSYIFASEAYLYLDKVLSISERNTDTDWITYRMPNGIDLYIEDGLVTAVCCREVCLYKGLNLIDMSFSDFLRLFDLEYPEKPDDRLFMANFGDLVDIYEYDDFGLQVWVYNGAVANLICSKD